MRGGTESAWEIIPFSIFQSTHPVRGGTRSCCPCPVPAGYFNPPTPCGVGLFQSVHSKILGKFQSTHPVRGGTRTWNLLYTIGIFQSTHPVRGGTNVKFANLCQDAISIHPPRAGWDQSQRANKKERVISIHPPRAGWDTVSVLGYRCQIDFNPPTPCGVGPWPRRCQACIAYFNPPTPCGVGHYAHQQPLLQPQFQSTHPVRGGTRGEPNQRCYHDISIHPPRAGWDPGKVLLLRLLSHFNPPTPCGVGRLDANLPYEAFNNFNPPTPCGVGQQKFTKHDCKLLHMQQNTSDTEMILPKISYHAILSGSFHCKIPVRTGKGIFVHFPFARSTKSLGRPLAHRSLWPQNARFWSDKHSPDSKTEDYPFSHP